MPDLRERIRKTKVQKSRVVVLCTALCFVSVPASRIQGHNSSFKMDSEYLTVNKKCSKCIYERLL